MADHREPSVRTHEGGAETLLRSSTPSEQTKPWLPSFKSDFLASIVVFLVALPLCMGIANACGLPPALGLITGILGGIVVGFLAGCPLQVSGPAAGLVVVIAGIPFGIWALMVLAQRDVRYAFRGRA